MSPIPLKRLVRILICLLFSILLFIILLQRIKHAYLEDDLLWFLPFLSQLTISHSMPEFIGILHSGELSFLHGVYFSALMTAFGFNFGNYIIMSFLIHCINAALFYVLLSKRIKLDSDISFLASLMYFTFYGHFHAYVWPLSIHHLLATFFLMLILCFYLKADEFIEKGQNLGKYYWATLAFSVLASFQRISVLIIPLTIFIHILFSTSVNKKILTKYTLWIPLFICFSSYQLAVLALGGQGDVLSGFLDPIYEMFGSTQNAIAVCLVVLLGVLGIVAVRFLLSAFLKNKPADLFYRLLGRCSFVGLLFPGIVVLCLYVFVWPVQSALYDDCLMRWQGIALPPAGTGIMLSTAFVLIMMLCFLWNMIKSNRHLIVFIPWYGMVVFYLSGKNEYIVSRYLMYAAPIFFVMFCFFFADVLPKLLSEKVSEKYRKIFYILVSLLLVVNMVSIKIRLSRTALVDYHWSYDYIKIANLIKNDIEAQKGRAYALSHPVCVSGIKPMPYKESWEKGFLKRYDFGRCDAFRQVLASALGRNTTENLIVKDICPDSASSYRVNDFTVLGQDDQSLEPFYRNFQEGIRMLSQGDDLAATESLKEAVAQKPFLIRFAMGPFVEKGMFSKVLKPKVADIIYRIYAQDYDGDEKMVYIDNMIQTEARDYGVALALLSYLQDRQGNVKEEERLLHEAALFVTDDAIADRLSQQHLSSSNFGNWLRFVAAKRRVFRRQNRTERDIKLETYRSFNIFWHDGFYFGLPRQDGDFSLAKFKAGRYKRCFLGRTKHQIREQVDAAWNTGVIDERELAPPLVPTSDYKGFMISKTGDLYVCSKDNFSFQARSLIEARLAVDTLLAM